MPYMHNTNQRFLQAVSELIVKDLSRGPSTKAHYKGEKINYAIFLLTNEPKDAYFFGSPG